MPGGISGRAGLAGKGFGLGESLLIVEHGGQQIQGIRVFLPTDFDRLSQRLFRVGEFVEAIASHADLGIGLVIGRELGDGLLKLSDGLSRGGFVIEQRAPFAKRFLRLFWNAEFACGDGIASHRGRFGALLVHEDIDRRRSPHHDGNRHRDRIVPLLGGDNVKVSIPKPAKPELALNPGSRWGSRLHAGCLDVEGDRLEWFLSSFVAHVPTNAVPPALGKTRLRGYSENKKDENKTASHGSLRFCGGILAPLFRKHGSPICLSLTFDTRHS